MQYITTHQFHNKDLYKANATCIRVVEGRERKRNIADITLLPRKHKTYEGAVF